MSETRKLAAILAADVAGYSRLTATDEERTVARLRALKSDLFDPAISAHHGRVVKRTGDGILIEFRSVVDAVRCAIEMQNGMVERNAGVPPERQILLRVGIHLGDVIEEADGDLMGDGVNIAARLEGICEAGGICLSNAAYEQVRDRVVADFVDLGEQRLKNITRPVRAYAIGPAVRDGEPARMAILAADVAGYSRLIAADEDRTLALLRALRRDVSDPAIAANHGRVVKRNVDGTLIEFPSVVDAVRSSIEVQNGMIQRNAGSPPEWQIRFRIGIHLGDVVEESDGDLMGYGVNIAARLKNICEPGAILLSEDAYRQVKSGLDLAVRDLGNKELKNIPEPVHVFAIDVAQPGKASPGERPRLSIVVLPFANIGGDPEQEYFVDGVMESLTTDLSRISGSFVIARNTAFTYKGKPIDAKQIGRELNVRYLLEGSVQRGGNRLRVNVQLIDAETGNHLWAERFDKPVADLFDMQDEIVARLAYAMKVQLPEAEAARLKRMPTGNPDAEDLALQGQVRARKAGYVGDRGGGCLPSLRTGARNRSRQCPRIGLVELQVFVLSHVGA